MATDTGPFKAEERAGYWICVDTRTGGAVSYPTSKSQAAKEAATMNRAYAAAIAELGPQS